MCTEMLGLQNWPASLTPLLFTELPITPIILVSSRTLKCASVGCEFEGPNIKLGYLTCSSARNIWFPDCWLDFTPHTSKPVAPGAVTIYGWNFPFGSGFKVSNNGHI